MFGENPRLPGDIQPDAPPDASIHELLDRLKANAARPPAPTQLHKTVPTYFPPAAQKATHVYTKNHKGHPLSPVSAGPFPIVEHLGKSCLRIRTGTFANGQPREEVHHWNNCTPTTLPESTQPATRATLGRPRQKS